MSRSQAKCHEIPKVREYCCVKFGFSEFEDPNLEEAFFWEGGMPLTPKNGLGFTVGFDVSHGKVKVLRPFWRVEILYGFMVSVNKVIGQG